MWKCVAGPAAIHFRFQPEGVGLLLGGNSVWRTPIRLGAEEPAGEPGRGDSRESWHRRSKVSAAHRVAVLRQPKQGDARRHHQTAARSAEPGGWARPDIGEVEGHVGQNQDHTEDWDQTGKQSEIRVSFPTHILIMLPSNSFYAQHFEL